jgi:hypothetical protein
MEIIPIFLFFKEIKPSSTISFNKIHPTGTPLKNEKKIQHTLRMTTKNNQITIFELGNVFFFFNFVFIN